jgi:hypothetical protein
VLIKLVIFGEASLRLGRIAQVLLPCRMNILTLQDSRAACGQMHSQVAEKAPASLLSEYL